MALWIFEVKVQNSMLYFINFPIRLGERLNIAFDRTPDQMIYRALKSCIARLPKELTLVDYSATESFNIENITGVFNISSILTIDGVK